MNKKRNKNKKSIFQSRCFLVLALIIAIATATLLALPAILKKGNDGSTDITYVLKGKITEKQTSCGREILSEDGTLKRVGGICDGGNSLEIDGVSISTGGGALVPLPVYTSNIESLHSGDVVEIRYVKDEEGYTSTNCKSCYIKKSGSSKPEPQTLIE
jgi:hypothetical protein